MVHAYDLLHYQLMVILLMMMTQEYLYVCHDDRIMMSAYTAKI